MKITLKKNNPIPYYLQIAQIFRDKIVSGELLPNSRIPSEEEIAEMYSVSRMTARNAITQLVNEDLVYRKHGLGAFVNHSKIRRNINKLTGFFEDMTRLGYKPSSKILELVRRSPNEREQRLLRLTKGEEVYHLTRIRYANETAVAFQSVAVPVQLVPDLPKVDLSHQSFYSYLEQNNIVIDRAEQRMEAVLSSQICKIMDIPKGMPFFYFERVSYTDQDVPIEVLDTYFRGDRYSYYITLHRDNIKE